MQKTPNSKAVYNIYKRSKHYNKLYDLNITQTWTIAQEQNKYE